MLKRPRLIPCLLLLDGGLVKTTQFKRPNYLGDPINTVKLFSEMGVDELCIQASRLPVVRPSSPSANWNIKPWKHNVFRVFSFVLV